MLRTSPTSASSRARACPRLHLTARERQRRAPQRRVPQVLGATETASRTLEARYLDLRVPQFTCLEQRLNEEPSAERLDANIADVRATLDDLVRGVTTLDETVGAGHDVAPRGQGLGDDRRVTSRNGAGPSLRGQLGPLCERCTMRQRSRQASRQPSAQHIVVP